MDILEKIKAIWEDSGKAYGVRKVWAELRNEGRRANYKRVARIMRKFHIIPHEGRRPQEEGKILLL